MSDTDENDLTVVQQQPAAFAMTEQDPMTWYTALAEKEASAAPAELRPPAEHAEKPLHWVQNPRGPKWIAQWFEGNKWQLAGGVGRWVTPRQLATDGYRYLGPAEWREPAFWEEEANKAFGRVADLEAQLTAAAALQTGGDSGEYWAETWHKCNLEREEAVHRTRKLEAQNGRLLNEVAMAANEGLLNERHRFKSHIAELELQVAAWRAERGAVPVRATAEPTVTPEMAEAGLAAWNELPIVSWGRVTAVYTAIYRAMRALEPMPVTPGLWSDDSYRALLAEVQAWRSAAVARSIAPERADEIQCRLLWWPRECAIPFFLGLMGERKVAMSSRDRSDAWIDRPTGDPDPLGPHLTALRGLP